MPTSFEVTVRFWTDAKIKAVSSDAKLVFLWLMGQDGYGIFRFYVEVGADETGLGQRRFRIAIARLIEQKVIRLEEPLRIAWVINRLRYRFPKGISEPQAKGLIRRLEDLPQESSILREFVNYYKAFIESLPVGLGKGLRDRLLKVGPNPSACGSPSSSLLLSSESEAVALTVNGFEEFWAAYPRKVGKRKAHQIWDRLAPPLKQVLSAIETQRRRAQWHIEGGRFIPHPSTWLMRGGWEDEIGAKFLEGTDDIPEHLRP